MRPWLCPIRLRNSDIWLLCTARVSSARRPGSSKLKAFGARYVACRFPRIYRWRIDRNTEPGGRRRRSVVRRRAPGGGGAGGARRPRQRARARPRAARHPRSCLARDLSGGVAPAHRLCAAADGLRQFRRSRGVVGPHRRRRISGADHGRHSDEPGRDRAPVRSRARPGGSRGADQSGGRASDRLRQHRTAPRAARRIAARATRRDGRRHRAR